VQTGRMKKLSLDAQTREHLERAAATPAGRSSATLFGGHENVLRQTIIALTAGTRMAEHDSPGEATVVVLRGRIRLSSGETSWEGRTGDLLAVPPERHSLAAIEDSAVLLTTAMSA
jgi:quercetin dioxygenase-like cupin family protein